MKARALLLLALAAPARAQKWFDAPLVVAAPPDEVRARGDLDGDGDVDLLRFYGATSSGIWISCTALLNDGTGRFSPGPTTPLPQNQNIAIRRPLLGDVTGDGLLDLVLTVSNSPTIRGVRLFPGTGGGGFGPSAFFSLPGNPLDLLLRDVDGNGALDVGVLSFGAASNPTARWLSWNGAGLASSAVVSIPSTAAISIASMDATGDGVPDLLVGEWFDPDVFVLPTVGGNPTLGSPLTIPGPLGDGRVLEAGDLDGDGDEDVLVTIDDYATGLWAVVLATVGTGSLAVGSPQLFSNTTVPFFYSLAVDLGDWDGDGDLDFFNHAENLTLFSNDGANTFAFAAVVPTDMDAPGAGPADFDGDGNLDFCAARALAFGNGTFHSVLLPAAGTYAPTASVSRDWEGDGDVDFLDTFGQALINDGSGSFSLTPSLWPAPAAAHLYRDPVAFADLDGDGRSDYLVGYFAIVPIGPPGMAIAVFEEMRLLRDDGVGGYVDAGAAAAPGTQIFLTLGPAMGRPVLDLDGDGDLDLLDGNGYRPNGGAGFFGPLVPLWTGVAADAGDVDGDGDPDVLATLFSPSQQVSLVLQRNLGGLVFSAQTLFTAFGLDSRARLLDVDGDGDLDAAVGYSSSGNQLHLVENVGGNFAPVVSLPAAPFVTQVIAAGDVDGDGLRDVVTGPFEEDPNGSRVNVFRRIGPGLVYQPRAAYLSRVVRDFPDLDGDGDLDVSGLRMAFGWSFDGPGAGGIRQYGAGVAGSGGAVPVLGATGPLRPGSTTAAVRLRRGLGGAPALLAVGTAEASLPDVPLPGMTTHVGGVVSFVPFTVLGAPGVAGAGTVDIPIPIPLLAVLTNASVFLQAALLDPAAPFFLTATNGLELHVGL